MDKKLCTLNSLTGAIGSPQGPAHYDVMSWVFNKMSKNNDFALAPKCHGACLQRHETCIFDIISTLNNVAPKCRVVSLQQLGTIPSIVENDNHCAKATLKTLITILITIIKIQPCWLFE